MCENANTFFSKIKPVCKRWWRKKRKETRGLTPDKVILPLTRVLCYCVDAGLDENFVLWGGDTEPAGVER
jgi:hypothetical protein